MSLILDEISKEYEGFI
ncbi:hypothetical protein [Parabacteroides distasonis]|nr:hypothetical protein [Parabacteroides distasonis]